MKDQTPLQQEEQKVVLAVPAPIKNDEYDKKIRRSKRRIIFNFSTSIFFIIFIFVTIFYNDKLTQNNISDVNYLTTKIGDLSNKSSNIESRVNDVKKYKQIWIKVPEKRKDFVGIKIIDLSNNFETAAKQFNLTGPTINLSPPEILKDSVYSKPTLEVQLVNCTINFQALTDRMAIDFIHEFLGSIPGYVIINNLSIKKNKKEGYSESELVDISAGRINGLTAGKVDFSWYSLKHKTQPTNQTTSEIKK